MSINKIWTGLGVIMYALITLGSVIYDFNIYALIAGVILTYVLYDNYINLK